MHRLHALSLVWLAGCSSILGIKDVTGDGSAAGDAPGPACTVGAMRTCYTGADGTSGVGPCHGGMQTCSPQGAWGDCDGEVTPQPERCGNGIDDNCSGQADEDVDLDHDGFTTCQGDCCDSTECANPAAVNPGAYDVPGNGIDDDCNGTPDDHARCDGGLKSDSVVATDAAKAMDVCGVADAGNRKWGLLGASFTLTDGLGTPDARSHAIRPGWGANVMPQAGAALAVISTGIAADEDDTNPTFASGTSTDLAEMADFPADWYAAHGGQLPTTPGCPLPTGAKAHDPVMLTLTVRVPTNARSFSFDTDFYTMEFPEFVCSAFNDFLVVLLDSTYAGTPANPSDKNLAVYTNAQLGDWPVGVNLATLDKGLFVQCVDGALGCSSGPGVPAASISTCVGTTELAGTGMEVAAPTECGADSLAGGATGWLETRGNVVGGETIKLRIAIWDTSDGILDSTALLDNFQWSTEATTAGTFAK